jgi:para-aminobenzoate synthetase component I
MTGAPKIRAMQIINEQEEFNRGLYSGSVGYITPDGNFDLNVVIRSIIYNDELKKISIPVGSAITAVSDAGKEYEECLLKAKALLSVIGSASTQKEINQP